MGCKEGVVGLRADLLTSPGSPPGMSIIANEQTLQHRVTFVPRRDAKVVRTETHHLRANAGTRISERVITARKSIESTDRVSRLIEAIGVARLVRSQGSTLPSTERQYPLANRARFRLDAQIQTKVGPADPSHRPTPT